MYGLRSPLFTNRIRNKAMYNLNIGSCNFQLVGCIDESQNSTSFPLVNTHDLIARYYTRHEIINDWDLNFHFNVPIDQQSISQSINKPCLSHANMGSLKNSHIIAACIKPGCVKYLIN